MRRTALLLAVTLALVLVGCSGPDSEAMDVTPVDVPNVSMETTDRPLGPPDDERTADPSATFRGIDMPPGTDERGIVDAEALNEAHTNVTTTTGFALSMNRSSKSWQNGSLTEAHSTTLDLEASPTAVRYRGRTVNRGTDYSREGYASNDTAAWQTVEGYMINGTSYVRTKGGNITYEVRNISAEREREARSFPYEWDLRNEDWIPVDRTRVGGRWAIVFQAGPDSSPNGTVVVDSQGVIHDFEYSQHRSSDNGRFTFNRSYDLDLEPAVTVKKPAWLPEAKNATGPR